MCNVSVEPCGIIAAWSLKPVCINVTGFPTVLVTAKGIQAVFAAGGGDGGQDSPQWVAVFSASSSPLQLRLASGLQPVTGASLLKRSKESIGVTGSTNGRARCHSRPLHVTLPQRARVMEPAPPSEVYHYGHSEKQPATAAWWETLCYWHQPGMYWKSVECRVERKRETKVPIIRLPSGDWWVSLTVSLLNHFGWRKPVDGEKVDDRWHGRMLNMWVKFCEQPIIFILKMHL